MSNSSFLSSSAQAVLAAIHAAPDDTRDSHRSSGAAALRAVAYQIYDELYYGRLFKDRLLAIADELDGNYLEKPDSSIDSNLKANLTSCQSVPASLVPMEYADLESGARIVCAPSEEGSGACWNVLNFSGIHSFTEFPSVDAAWQAMQRIKEEWA